MNERTLIISMLRSANNPFFTFLRPHLLQSHPISHVFREILLIGALQVHEGDNRADHRQERGGSHQV